MWVGVLFVGVALVTFGAGWAQEGPPVVVIHEFGQGRAGNGEWVELLVVGTGPGSTVDLRGWVLRDRQGQGGVWLRFSEHRL